MFDIIECAITFVYCLFQEGSTEDVLTLEALWLKARYLFFALSTLVLLALSLLAYIEESGCGPSSRGHAW